MIIPTSSGLDRQFGALNSKVLAYIGPNARGAQLAAYADGAVFHGNAGFGAARQHKGQMLYAIDPERYAADRLPQAQERIDESAGDAVNAQVDAGAGLLVAPSRFLWGTRDNKSIKSSLKDGHEFVAAAQTADPQLPAIVPIVVRFDELEDRRWVKPVASAELPIATVFAGHGDPLSMPGRLEGAIELIQAASVAVVLRCDMSTVGLMAVGAVAGAIGTSSSVRHLWLPSRRSGRRTPAPSIFVPAVTSWVKATFIEQAQADPRLDDLFRCDCSVCGEDGDVRALTSQDVEPGRHAEHSIAAAVRLAHRVLSAQDPVERWVRTCQEARDAYNHLGKLGISGPTMPGALESWISVLGGAPEPATSRRRPRRSPIAAS